MNYVCDDILHVEDLEWRGSFIVDPGSDTTIVNNYFESWKQSIEDKPCSNQVIEEPVLVIHTLHSCYSHAIIDEIVIYFSIIKAIHPDKKWRIFIRRGDVEKHLEQNMRMIQDNNYTGAWKHIIESISPYPPIFEHTLSKDEEFTFKSCYLYPLIDHHHRSIWNCIEYYPDYTQRVLCKDAHKYPDNIIYSYLSSYRDHILAKYGKNCPQPVPRVVIIDRKYNRKFWPHVLRELEYRASLEEGWSYEEPYILEDMDFTEQVNLFRNAKIFIFNHGSSLTNLLWIPEGSVVFDLDSETNRKGIIDRVCLLTKSTHHYIDHNNMNISEQIFDPIRSYCAHAVSCETYSS